MERVFVWFWFFLLFVVVPSSGIDCIAAFLKNRIQSYIHIADDVADEVLR